MDEFQKNDVLVNIEDIMHSAYLQYSLSVNVGRAIPDVRDGLKPGNRRILYAMRQLGLSKSHSYTKSAKVVGEVIGNYHPHGDSSVYDTLVRMAQDFAMSMPLIDGQGNFGSIDGDPAAAYRYTECRMERIAEELLSDIEKNTVNMIPTFDESTLEPEVLPAKFPHLLVNGTTGIGVGMATNIPPHSLEEVINGTICLLDNPNVTIEELMVHIPGPDFPTGATLRGTKEIKRLYKTGRGILRIRSKAEIIEKNDKEQIIVTEIPYAQNKENLVKKIADLVRDKKITGITALRDETSRRAGIRIVIDISRNALAMVVLNQLYIHTSLENSFGCTMLVVDKNKPKTLNLIQILQAYLDHRLEVITRRTQFELDKAEARAHILEGLLIAVKNIDEIVKIIRKSRTKQEAAETLIARFEFSKKQVAAILEMRLHQLTGLAIDTLQEEYDALLARINYLKELLASRELLLGVIKTELIEVRDKHSVPRRTLISNDDRNLCMADLIERHSCTITVSSTGYIKRVNSETYSTQHRGGKGRKGMKTKDEDFVEHLFNADSHDIIFFITEKGLMHWLYVWEIPEGNANSKGKAIINLIKIEPGEQIKTMLTIKEEDLERDDLYMVMATHNGYVKKTGLNGYKNLRKGGLRAIHIGDDDDLIEAAISDGKSEFMLSTAKGQACRFFEEKVRPTGRTSRGVLGIRFKLDDDYLVGMEVLPELEETEDDENATGPELLVLSNNGIAKRSYISTYRRTNRGAKGVRTMKLDEGATIVKALQIEQGDEIMITTEQGQMTRVLTDEIKVKKGRATRGVKIMTLAKNDLITGVAKIVKVDKEENEEGNDTDENPEIIDAVEVVGENVETVEVSEEPTEESSE